MPIELTTSWSAHEGSRMTTNKTIINTGDRFQDAHTALLMTAADVSRQDLTPEQLMLMDIGALTTITSAVFPGQTSDSFIVFSNNVRVAIRLT